MNPTPTIKELLRQSLAADGYDGLYHPARCACVMADLMPCGELSTRCRAGYLQQGDTDDDTAVGFTIVPVKQGG